MNRQTFFKSLIGLAVAPAAISAVFKVHDQLALPTEQPTSASVKKNLYGRLTDAGIVYIGDEYEVGGNRYIVRGFEVADNVRLLAVDAETLLNEVYLPLSSFRGYYKGSYQILRKF